VFASQMLSWALIFARPDWQSLIFGHGPHVLSEKCEDAAFASQMLPRALIFARPDWQSLIFGHGSHTLSFFRSHLRKLAVEGLKPRHLNLSMLLWADPNMPSIVPSDQTNSIDWDIRKGETFTQDVVVEAMTSFNEAAIII
jgi:hypothetical protein